MVRFVVCNSVITPTVRPSSTSFLSLTVLWCPHLAFVCLHASGWRCVTPSYLGCCGVGGGERGLAARAEALSMEWLLRLDPS